MLLTQASRAGQAAAVHRPLSIPEMGDDLFSYGFQMTDPILSGTGDAEDDMASPGVNELLETGYAAFHRPQQAVVANDFKEVSSIEVPAP